MYYKSATVDSFGSQVIELLENSLRLLKNVCLLIKVVRFLQSEEHPREIVSEKRVRWKQVAEKNQESSSTSERRVARQWNASGRLWSKGTLLRLPVHMLDTDITEEKERGIKISQFLGIYEDCKICTISVDSFTIDYITSKTIIRNNKLFKNFFPFSIFSLFVQS